MSCRPLFRLWSIALVLSVAATASPFSAVVVYGDSLSDNGNLFAVAGQPGPPYFQGRASNGPVAAEILAANLGAPLLDYAFGGATSGVGNHLDPGGTPTTTGTFGLPGMLPLYQNSLSTITPLAPAALFVVWGGVNDFLSPSPLDTNAVAVANRAVSNIVSIATGLQGIGAQHILVPGLPDLGLTPFNRLQGPIVAAQASALSDYFNMRLMAALPPGVVFLDTAAILRAVIGNPGAYGLTNVTDACLDTTAPSLCSNPGQYLFWDDIHPSARGHEILAAQFTAAAVPEPSTFGLAACALVLVWFRASSSKASKTGLKALNPLEPMLTPGPESQHPRTRGLG